MHFSKSLQRSKSAKTMRCFKRIDLIVILSYIELPWTTENVDKHLSATVLYFQVLGHFLLF